MYSGTRFMGLYSFFLHTNANFHRTTRANILHLKNTLQVFSGEKIVAQHRWSNLSKVSWLNHDLNWGQLDSEASKFILPVLFALAASAKHCWPEEGLLLCGRGKGELKCRTFVNWSPYQKPISCTSSLFSGGILSLHQSW